LIQCTINKITNINFFAKENKMQNQFSKKRKFTVQLNANWNADGKSEVGVALCEVYSLLFFSYFFLLFLLVLIISSLLILLILLGGIAAFIIILSCYEFSSAFLCSYVWWDFLIRSFSVPFWGLWNSHYGYFQY